MRETVEMGFNRTGIQMAPALSTRMVEDARAYSPETTEGEDIETVRADFLVKSSPVGTVPLPGSVKGAAATILKKLRGENPELLIDRLAERLAFERTGARLYEALLMKCELSDLPDLPLERLREIHGQEIQHFHLLKEVIESFGADPTAQTPSADVIAVASMGLVQAAFDPRVDVVQTLNVLQTAELTDNVGWEQLIELCERAGLTDIADRFEQVRLAEAEHLSLIQGLMRQLLNLPQS